jgi:hypothetical protein
MTMDQPTAERALKEMEVLVGEWSQTATPAGSEPWPGEAKATFEWLEGGQLLLERSTVETLEAPNSVCVYGCDAANGTYRQLYADDRNVCRVYQMGIGRREWKLWREGAPFNQRFTGRLPPTLRNRRIHRSRLTGYVGQVLLRLPAGGSIGRGLSKGILARS